MEKEILFIPGWPYLSDYFSFGPGISPWDQSDAYKQNNYSKDFYIGHSMGSSVALEFWLKDKEASVILVNPFIERKNILLTFVDFLKYAFFEGIYDKKFLTNLKCFPLNILRLWRFPSKNYWEILKLIPKEKIVVLHGSNDLYLCGNEVKKKIGLMGIKISEIENSGHNWNENFDQEVLRIIKIKVKGICQIQAYPGPIDKKLIMR